MKWNKPKGEKLILAQHMCIFTFESLCNALKVCRQHLGSGVWQLHHFSQLLWRSRMGLGLLMCSSNHLEQQGCWMVGMAWRFRFYNNVESYNTQVSKGNFFKFIILNVLIPWGCIRPMLCMVNPKHAHREQWAVTVQCPASSLTMWWWLQRR